MRLGEEKGPPMTEPSLKHPVDKILEGTVGRLDGDTGEANSERPAVFIVGKTGTCEIE